MKGIHTIPTQDAAFLTYLIEKKRKENYLIHIVSNYRSDLIEIWKHCAVTLRFLLANGLLDIPFLFKDSLAAFRFLLIGYVVDHALGM